MRRKYRVMVRSDAYISGEDQFDSPEEAVRSVHTTLDNADRQGLVGPQDWTVGCIKEAYTVFEMQDDGSWKDVTESLEEIMPFSGDNSPLPEKTPGPDNWEHALTSQNG